MRRFFPWLFLLSLLLPFQARADENNFAITTDQLPHSSGGVAFTNSDSVGMAAGTTQLRPPVPEDGAWRLNTTLGCPEQYSAASLSGWRCGGGYRVPPGAAYVFNKATSLSTNSSLGSLRVPGGIIGPYGCLRVTFGYVFSGTTSTKTMLGNWSKTQGDLTGGSGFLNLTTSTATNLSIANWRVFCNIQSQSQQSLSAPSNNALGSGLSGTVTNTAVDTSVDSWINLNGSISVGTDFLRLVFAFYEVIIP